MPIFLMLIASITSKRNIGNEEIDYDKDIFTGDYVSSLIEFLVMGVPIVLIIFSTKYVSMMWTIIMMVIYFTLLTWYLLKNI